MANSKLQKERVLILCTGNSARSQMAEGFLRHAGGERFEVFSAGTHPGQVREEAVLAMQDWGVDLSGHRSKSVDEFAGQQFDYVVTVCDNAKENCPIFPGEARRVHWSFDDPAAAVGDFRTRVQEFRRVRDEIAARFREYFNLS
jgi:arsenate reductase